MLHRLTYRRRNHNNLHVRGYKEEGIKTTPFDMVVLNNMDRFQPALDAIRRISRLKNISDMAVEKFYESMQRHKIYVSENGEDLPEVRDWKWDFCINVG
jgi:xylulose-5-phosphate/fructose-6-phosphate phosphoketolase